MKKILGFVSTSFVAYLLLITGPVAVTSCEKEIIRDTIIITDTLVVKDTLTIIDSVCYDLKDGLVAWYNFNGGTLKDSSGQNNHITFSNTTLTTDRFGKANNAVLFNGNGSYMSVPNSASLNPKKISMQVIFKLNGYYTGPCHASNLLSKGWPDFANGFYTMRVGTFQACNAVTDTTKEIVTGGFGDNGNPYGSAAGVAADTVGIRTGQWYNVIYTYDGTTSKIYVNGKLKNTAIKSATASGNNQELFIGKHGDPQFPYWLNGIIDELRIYDKALCDGEIKQLSELKN